LNSILKGLEFLHTNNIGHRDIKTENLLLNEDFTLKIADFGFASELLDENKEKIFFPSAVAVGSPE
jgi:serine/threonine protein kinase